MKTKTPTTKTTTTATTPSSILQEAFVMKKSQEQVNIEKIFKDYFDLFYRRIL